MTIVHEISDAPDVLKTFAGQNETGCYADELVKVFKPFQLFCEARIFTVRGGKHKVLLKKSAYLDDLFHESTEQSGKSPITLVLEPQRLPQGLRTGAPGWS